MYICIYVNCICIHVVRAICEISIVCLICHPLEIKTLLLLFATPIGTAGASGRFYDITCKYYGHVVGVLRK